VYFCAQNGASSFNAFSTTQSVVNIQTGGKTMYSVDASGNLFVASSVTTDKSALRYAAFLGCRRVLSEACIASLPATQIMCVFVWRGTSLFSFVAPSVLLDSNNDGNGLLLNFTDASNRIQFPNSSGTVILDTDVNTVTSQVCALCWLRFVVIAFVTFTYFGDVCMCV
jgi:hypothetical protein